MVFFLWPYYGIIFTTFKEVIMRVILLQDVKGQGKKDDIINVSDGYANNFLIKKGLAVQYSKRSNEVLEKSLSERQAKEDALVAEYNEMKKKLDNKELTFKVSTGKEDKVFGTVSTKQISEKLNTMGYKIDKKCIKQKTNIDSLGTHIVEIELHKKVKFNVRVVLVK
jgi:large subunit ribosomal protein L9